MKAGAYRIAGSKAVTDPVTLRSLADTLARSRTAETATDLWRTRGLLPADRAVGATIVAASSYPALDGKPTLVQLPVIGEDETPGPLIGVSRKEIGAMVGPYRGPVVIAFTLDGRSYVHANPANCARCGDIGDQVLAVEKGKFRLAFESFAAAN
jgi:hypothetical protein